MLGFKKNLLITSLSAVILLGCNPMEERRQEMAMQQAKIDAKAQIQKEKDEAKQAMDYCLSTAFSSPSSDQSCLNFISMSSGNKLGDVLNENGLLVGHLQVSRDCIINDSVCIASGYVAPKTQRAFDLPFSCGNQFFLYSKDLVNWTSLQYAGIYDSDRVDYVGYTLEQNDTKELNLIIRTQERKYMGCF